MGEHKKEWHFDSDSLMIDPTKNKSPTISAKTKQQKRSIPSAPDLISLNQEKIKSRERYQSLRVEPLQKKVKGRRSSYGQNQVLLDPYLKAAVSGRGAALILDLLLVNGAYGGLLFYLEPELMAQARSMEILREVQHYNSLYAALFLILIYFPTAYWGRTLGKLCMGIKVVKVEDPRSPPGFMLSLIREFLGKSLSLLFFGLGYFWALFGNKGRAWHDYVAATRVIKSQQK